MAGSGSPPGFSSCIKVDWDGKKSDTFEKTTLSYACIFCNMFENHIIHQLCDLVKGFGAVFLEVLMISNPFFCPTRL